MAEIPPPHRSEVDIEYTVGARSIIRVIVDFTLTPLLNQRESLGICLKFVFFQAMPPRNYFELALKQTPATLSYFNDEIAVTISLIEPSSCLAFCNLVEPWLVQCSGHFVGV